MLLKIIGILAVCILISGCEIFGPSGTIVSIDTLLSSPVQIEIDGREYLVETFLYRDFMPFCPPDGMPLIAIIWVTAIDSLPFPSSIDANLLWVINGQEVWETKFSDEEILQEPYRRHQLEKFAKEGPKWGPGIQVHVVVRVVDQEGNTYLLRASNQWIGRTS